MATLLLLVKLKLTTYQIVHISRAAWNPLSEATPHRECKSWTHSEATPDLVCNVAKVLDGEPFPRRL